MSADGFWSIGELAARAGVTVKTVRFYSDRGLLPAAGRSSGGHRRYGPGALDRLRLIRSLRSLDLPVPDVERVLDREDDLEDLVAERLSDLGTRLAALRWREAALRSLQGCGPEERADRLRLIGAVAMPPDTTALARFWRRWLGPARLPAPLLAAVVDAAVPEPPAEPNPSRVLAFARLHALVSGDCRAGAAPHQPAAHRPDAGVRPAVLYAGLREAYDLAAPELRAGRPPVAGEALDGFVSAYARAGGVRDIPAFRRLLGRRLAADPRIDRYWDLVAELTAPDSGPAEPTPGAAHDWLLAALAGTSGEGPGPGGANG
ncbi:MerR family transcriptional regulator [Streptomyces sp. LP05-1]|uniref:MerR family transcriptional regulator n=1 Tax=Streptomyces pyxinae TaxID=2970734 RepID=A0ABT2CDE2_9ACTN|nr:MerR family transcriptional regulator [Streptomyces sp. LP05-1]MCS0635433.1 MerR family transcriptional regulator [Streptomyces sp. LP05-1]